ncbi:uncharacterized protein LOC108704364 [Xenopus laevis]|uniref:Uncharacterized protein LOC108704364 n=1 Tax=Xenopus laevis TaxID=8355 RepID=A0A8J1MJ87_XENLA|nr:uncharacterized protein LOC108704364 [Xenopus laevis]
MRNDRMPCTLKPVRKEEYLQFYCIDTSYTSAAGINPNNDPRVFYLSQECGTDITMNEVVENTNNAHFPPSTSSDLMDFERYMQYYQQTMDTLVENRVISQEDVSHHVVSKAVSDVWQDLLQEGKVELYLKGCQQARMAARTLVCLENMGFAETSVPYIGADSEEATSSILSSTPLELLFEDALDIASGILDQSNAQDVATPSSPWEWQQADRLLYSRVIDFLKTCLCSYSQEETKLQCTYLPTPAILYYQNAEQPYINMAPPNYSQDASLQYNSTPAPMMVYSQGALLPYACTNPPEYNRLQNGAQFCDGDEVRLICTETLDDDL